MKTNLATAMGLAVALGAAGGIADPLGEVRKEADERRYTPLLTRRRKLRYTKKQIDPAKRKAKMKQAKQAKQARKNRK